MGRIRAQVTTRSGPPGTKDAPSVVAGEFTVDWGRQQRAMVATILGCLEQADTAAKSGMVTEVSVLVYQDAIGGEL